jgi:hypothetical protein
LDQLQIKDIGQGIQEMNFESLETPLGVFHLHVAYRMECEFAVDKADILDQYIEPAFFQPNEVARRRNSNHSSSQAVSQPSESFMRMNMDSKRVTRIREGVTIPNSNIKDLRRASLNLNYSASPDTQFRLGMVPTARSYQSQHFLPFTPPQSEETQQEFSLDYSNEIPPFSTDVMIKSDASKFTFDKPELLSYSPPFAMASHHVSSINQSNDTNKSLTMIRKPSYIFPSSPSTLQNTPPAHPVLFTPTSSFAHPALRALRPSPPMHRTGSDATSDIENFLSSLEQSQSLRITSGSQSYKPSLLKGSVGASQHLVRILNQNALDRFKELEISNFEFAKELEVQAESVEKSSVPGNVTLIDLDTVFVGGYTLSFERKDPIVRVSSFTHECKPSSI